MSNEPKDPVQIDSKEDGDDGAPKDQLSTKGGGNHPVSRLDTFTMIDDKTRSFIHSKLRAYEARRKAAYSGKLESSALYWRSFRDLLTTSVHETSRAERLVLGVAKANALYSEQMLASYEDVLVDDKGCMVLDQKKQLRLLEVRSTQDYAAAPLSPSSGEHQEQRSFLLKQRRSNMLTPLIDSQAILADKFSENAKQMESEIASELTRLRVELENKVDFIRQVGDAIIAELEATETEVAQTWDSYYAVAVKTLPGSEGEAIQKTRSSTSEGEETEIVEDCLDVWLVEMHYRVTVAYQSFAWEKASTELSKLFSSMKETECRRRVSVREYLVAFTQRQERLFSILPDVHTPVLKQLVGRAMDRPTLEAAVQDEIRRRADRLAKEDERMKSQRKIKSPSVVDDKEGNFTLQSPMHSELMCRARVVERKGTGMMASWRLSLAVITVDSFLHLFDLPPGKASLGTAPEVAFQTLVPKVEIHDSDPTKNSKKGNVPATNFIKGWCDLLTPSETMVLPNCSISQPKLGRDTSSFELQEAIFNTGASKMFGKTTTKRVTLRTINKRETQEWILALKSRK